MNKYGTSDISDLLQIKDDGKWDVAKMDEHIDIIEPKYKKFAAEYKANVKPNCKDSKYNLTYL